MAALDLRQQLPGHRHIAVRTRQPGVDRVIASRLGYSAVTALLEGEHHNSMIGILNNKVHYTPLGKAAKATQKMDQEWFKIIKILAS